MGQKILGEAVAEVQARLDWAGLSWNQAMDQWMRRGTITGGFGKHDLGLERVAELGRGRASVLERAATLSSTRPRILASKQHLLEQRLRQPRRQGTHRQS